MKENLNASNPEFDQDKDGKDEPYVESESMEVKIDFSADSEKQEDTEF
jgi:hypothetical protein